MDLYKEFGISPQEDQEPTDLYKEFGMTPRPTATWENIGLGAFKSIPDQFTASVGGLLQRSGEIGALESEKILEDPGRYVREDLYGPKDVHVRKGSMWDPSARRGKSYQRGLADLPEDFVEGEAARVQAEAELTLPEQKLRARIGEGMRHRAEERIEQRTPVILKDQWGKQFAQDVGTGIGKMIPSLALGTGTALLAPPLAPVVGVGAFMPLVKGDVYGAKRDRSVSVEQADFDSSVSALIEGGTEALVFGRLWRMGGPVVKKVLDVTVGEGLSEGASSLLQSAYDAGILKEEMTLAEALKEAGYETLIGAGMGLGMGGGAIPSHIASEKQAIRQIKSIAENARFNGLADGALDKLIDRGNTLATGNPKDTELASVMAAFKAERDLRREEVGKPPLSDKMTTDAGKQLAEDVDRKTAIKKIVDDVQRQRAEVKGEPTTIPETKKTLEAQMDAFRKKAKPAVLFTPGTTLPGELPEGARIDWVPGENGGALVHWEGDNAYKALLEGRTDDALGIGIDEKPPGATHVETAIDKEGRVVTDTVTDDRQSVKDAAKRLAGPGGMTVTRPATEAIAERLGEIPSAYPDAVVTPPPETTGYDQPPVVPTTEEKPSAEKHPSKPVRKEGKAPEKEGKPIRRVPKIDEAELQDREKATEKEPWEMTAAEFDNAVQKGKLIKRTGKVLPGEAEAKTPLRMGEINKYLGQDIAYFYAKRRGYPDKKTADYDPVDAGRKELITDAISEGKPVPPEILADYPDLTAKEGQLKEVKYEEKKTTTQEAEAEKAGTEVARPRIEDVVYKKGPVSPRPWSATWNNQTLGNGGYFSFKTRKDAKAAAIKALKKLQADATGRLIPTTEEPTAKVGSYARAENGSIGKVDSVHDDGTVTINLGDTSVFFQKFTVSTESAYYDDIRKRAKEKRKSASRQRKEASEFNKKWDGEPVERKGLVDAVPSRLGGGIDIIPGAENKLSKEHRDMLDRAKQISKDAKALEDLLPSKMPRKLAVTMKMVKTGVIPGLTSNDGMRITNIPKALLDHFGWKSVWFKTGQPQRVFGAKGLDANENVDDHLFDGDVSNELIPYLKKRLISTTTEEPTDEQISREGRQKESTPKDIDKTEVRVKPETVEAAPIHEEGVPEGEHEEEVDVGKLVNSLKTRIMERDAPDIVKAFQELGGIVAPGIRLQDADEAGRMFVMATEGDVTLDGWSEFVAKLKKENRIKGNETPLDPKGFMAEAVSAPSGAIPPGWKRTTLTGDELESIQAELKTLRDDAIKFKSKMADIQKRYNRTKRGSAKNNEYMGQLTAYRSTLADIDAKTKELSNTIYRSHMEDIVETWDDVARIAALEKLEHPAGKNAYKQIVKLAKVEAEKQGVETKDDVDWVATQVAAMATGYVTDETLESRVETQIRSLADIKKATKESEEKAKEKEAAEVLVEMELRQQRAKGMEPYPADYKPTRHTPTEFGVTPKYMSWMPVRYKGGIVYSNGHVLDVTEPKLTHWKKHKERIDAGNFDEIGDVRAQRAWKDYHAGNKLDDGDRVVPDVKSLKRDKLTPTAIYNWKSEGVDYHTVYLEDQDGDVHAVAQVYYDYFLKKYPDAEFYRSGDVGTALVVVNAKKDTVGVMMPMRSDITTAEGVREILAERDLLTDEEKAKPLYSEARPTESAIADLPLFSRDQPPSVPGMPVADLRTLYQGIIGKSSLEDMGISLVQSQEEVPDSVRRGRNISGAYDPSSNEVWLVADAVKNEAEAIGVLLHEGIHAEFREMLGPELYRATVRQMREMESRGQPNVVEAFNQVPNNVQDAFYVEEAIAYLVQNQAARKLPIVRRIISAIRAWLLRNKIFTKQIISTLTPDDLTQLAWASVKSKTKGTHSSKTVTMEVGVNKTVAFKNDSVPKQRVIRYKTKSGKGLMNNEVLDRMKLTDDEEFELMDLMDFGLEQPRDVSNTAIFAFTPEGDVKHKRLIELLSKAAKEPVIREELLVNKPVLWETLDGQVAFAKETEVSEEAGGVSQTDPNILYSEQRDYTTEQQEALDVGRFGKKAPKGPLRTRMKEYGRRFTTRLRQGLVDQYASFRDIIDDPTAWMMAHQSHAGAGALESAIQLGQPLLDESGAIKVDTSKKHLTEILQPLENEDNDWLAWMAGNRANQINERSRENQQRADALKEEAKAMKREAEADIHGTITVQDRTRIKKTIALAKKKMVEANKLARLAKVKERRFSEKNIAALMSLNKGEMADGRSRVEVYESVRNDFEELGNAINKIGVETGLINETEARRWAEEGFYVPFYRMIEEAGEKHGPMSIGALTGQQAYKKLKGADLPLNDLLLNVLLNWSHIITASLKNQAGTRALEDAVDMGLAEQVDKHAKSKKAVFVRKNGQEVWYEVDKSPDGKLILDSLLSLNYSGMNNFAIKIMRKFKRALTIGVTASPEFRVANLIRDSLHSIAVVPMSTNIAKNVVHGWIATKKGGEHRAQSITGGGLFGDSGYIHGSDPEAIRHLVEKGTKRETRLDARWAIKKMWDAWSDFGARVENVNRMAAFDEAIRDGKSLLEANFEARDLLDFSRSGSWPAVRFLTATVPFLNARLQGLDKMARAARDPKQQKQFGTVMTIYAIASVLLYLYMKDDDDYKEAEQWERDTYHLFKIPGSEIMYRLPRPFEVGAVATIAERAVEQVVNEEVHGELFAERLGHALKETLAFNPIPQAFHPILEIYANKNSFTQRPIESMGMTLANLSPTERKRAWTSETAIGVSKGMDAISWGKVVLSPVQIEHLVKGYLGWAGAQSMAAMDYLTRFAINAPETPTMRYTDLPILKRFAVEQPRRYTAYITAFYDRVDEANSIYGDIKHMREFGEREKAIEKQRESRNKLMSRKYLNRVRRQISKINKQMSKIRLGGLSADSKRRELNALQTRKNYYAKRAVILTNAAF